MTMIKLRAVLGIFLLGIAVTPPCAAQMSTTTTTAIAARLQDLYPATRFGEVRATPWPGVFEVVMGSNLAYVDASGQYFLFGHLYDMNTQRDLSAERRESLNSIDFSALPLTDALKDVRGRGTRTLAIFSDPDCPYCRKLETELKDLTDVTIYTFLYPLASLHPHARTKAIGVWCAENRVASWRQLMLHAVDPMTRECDHPIDRNVALGERLGISGTPTLIAGDGRMLPGAASSAQVNAWLTRSKSSTEAQAKRGSANQ